MIQRDLVALIRKRGILATRDAIDAGFHSQELTRLVARGLVERIARGQYRLPGRAVTQHHGLVIVSRAAPKGVVCLLSALGFHGIGTQLPHEVWFAIPGRSRAPVISNPPVRAVRFSEKSFKAGIEEHRIEGQTIRVYSVTKTLADLFKFRNKVGLDVVLEAFREAWRRKKFKMDDLDRYAKICRVERVMRPYIESVIA